MYYNQNSARSLSRQEAILRQVSLLILIGIGLLCFVIFAPNAGPHQGAFYVPALQTRWSDWVDFPAVWSSIKIILFCIGLFLVIESAGTVLAVLKLKSLALFVFFLQAVPFMGLLFGCYYLVKSFL
jgi:hypothetical protein